MFKYLSQEDMKVVLGSLEAVDFKASEAVIMEGGDGDCVYVVESG